MNIYLIVFIYFIFNRKDWTQNQNEAIDAKNLPNDIKPVKLQFKLSDEMKKDIAIAATHIDAYVSHTHTN